MVALRILNDGTDTGHVVTSRTGSRLDGNEVGINVLPVARTDATEAEVYGTSSIVIYAVNGHDAGTGERITGRNDGNVIRVWYDAETTGVHGKD